MATHPERSEDTAGPSLDEVEAVFQALSHPARRHVVLLLSHLGGELSSGYLAARFQHSWPTTTRHLKVLEKAGLVTVRREGRSSHYRLDRERLARVVSGWLRQVNPVGPDQTWRSAGPRTIEELTRDPRTGRSGARASHPTDPGPAPADSRKRPSISRRTSKPPRNQGDPP